MPQRVDDIDRSLKFSEIMPNPEFKRPVNPPIVLLVKNYHNREDFFHHKGHKAHKEKKLNFVFFLCVLCALCG